MGDPNASIPTPQPVFYRPMYGAQGLATAQTAVDGAKDKGVADVKAVNPEAAKKPAAKKAVEDALKAKVDAIDARTDLTDDEKKCS